MTKSFFRYCILLPLVLIAMTKGAFGQERFTGIVVDSATLSALPGVNVQVKGAFRGTSTDEHGNFAIQATRNDTLVFSLVGYQTLVLPLFDYEAGMIRLNEQYTLLQAITIDDYRMRDMYQGMFDEQNSRRSRRLPFYYSKAKKEQIKLEVLRTENELVKTYVEVVISDPEFKIGMMKKHSLTEREYYSILMAFNERHHEMMYYLTRAELVSMLNTFFERESAIR
jgi:hypothetical protein